MSPPEVLILRHLRSAIWIIIVEQGQLYPLWAFVNPAAWTRVHAFNRAPRCDLLLKSGASWKVTTIVIHGQH